MLSAFPVLPHGRLSLSSPRLVEAWPVQTPSLVRLACWLGNRPLIEAGLAAGRPFGTSPGRVCLTLATASQKRKQEKQGA